MKNKKTLIILILIITMISLGGCMKKSTDNTSIKDEMLNYMEEKYDEKFEFVIGDTQLWSANYSEIIVSSENFPEESIYVRKDSETGEITDNYMGFILNNEIEEYLSGVSSKVYGENKVFNLKSSSTTDTDKSITIKQYLTRNETCANFTVFVKSDIETKEDDIKNYISLLQGEGISVLCTIIYLDSDKLNTINITNYEKYLDYDDGILMKGQINIDSGGELLSYEWR